MCDMSMRSFVDIRSVIFAGNEKNMDLLKIQTGFCRNFINYIEVSYEQNNYIDQKSKNSIVTVQKFYCHELTILTSKIHHCPNKYNKKHMAESIIF